MPIKVTIELDKELDQFDAWINGTRMERDTKKKRSLTGQARGIAYLTWHARSDPGTRFTITMTNAVRTADKKNKFERGIPKQLFLGAGTEKIKIG